MHKDFADWYRRVHIDPKEDDLVKRWQAIEAFHTRATSSDLSDAARLFFGQPARDAEFLQKYQAEFKASDSAFSMRDNDAELRVLAGATLANHFDEGGERATVTALALVCGAFGGNRKGPVSEIVELASRTLRNRSLSLRAAKKAISIPPLDVIEKLKNLKSQLGIASATVQTLQGPLLEVLEPVVKALTGITTWMTVATIRDDLRQEESDILWWLFGERSRDLDVPFGDLKPPFGCLLGPKEVADLTRVLPGPFGVQAYLYKMLGLAHPELDGMVSLSDAVVVCPLEWQQQFIKIAGMDAVSDLCPVHFAAQKCAEAGGKKNSWHAPFETAFGIKATIKLKPLDLAIQTYRERLFAVAMNQLQEFSDE